MSRRLPALAAEMLMLQPCPATEAVIPELQQGPQEIPTWPASAHFTLDTTPLSQSSFPLPTAAPGHFVLTVQPREAEHANLVRDVVPGARGPQGLQARPELRAHQQDPICHRLHVVLPAAGGKQSVRAGTELVWSMTVVEPASPFPLLLVTPTTRQRAAGT